MISTHYQDVKGDTKCRKRGALGSLKDTENSVIRQSAYKFLLAFHSNHVPNCHSFLDIVRYWLKSADCNLSHLYLVPPLGVTLLGFRGDFWHQKTRVPGLSYDIICMILCLAVFVVLAYDRQTHDSIYHASMASRCKNRSTGIPSDSNTYITVQKIHKRKLVD